MFLAALIILLAGSVTDVLGRFRVLSASSLNQTNVTCVPAFNLIIRTAYFLTPIPDYNMTQGDVMRLYRHCQRRQGAECDLSTAGFTRDFNITYLCLKEPILDPCSNMTSNDSSNHLTFLVDYARHKTANDVTCQCTLTMTSSSSENSSIYVRALNLFDDGSGSANGNGGVSPNESGPGRPMIEISYDRWNWSVGRRPTPVEGQMILRGVQQSSGHRNSTSLMSLSFRGLQAVLSGRVWVDVQGPNMEVSCDYTWVPGPLFTPEKASKPGIAGSTLLEYILGTGGTLMVILVVVIFFAVAAQCRHSRRARKSKPLSTSPDIIGADNHSIGPASHHPGRDTVGDNHSIGPLVAHHTGADRETGVYCTINEARHHYDLHDLSNSSAQPPRDPQQPNATSGVNRETAFGTRIETQQLNTVRRVSVRLLVEDFNGLSRDNHNGNPNDYFLANGRGDPAHSQANGGDPTYAQANEYPPYCQTNGDPPYAQPSHPGLRRWEEASEVRKLSISNSEYGTLCHRPVHQPVLSRRASSSDQQDHYPIYDHATAATGVVGRCGGISGGGGGGGEGEGEEVYHHLQHGRRGPAGAPRVIDNVYDTAASVGAITTATATTNVSHC